ncbi:ribosome assembly RNA-binding protein YhbY [Endozoicomonas sp. SM1973]|uniref:Ribosome assembly RNA-binding protein YhbY n=1 Tax=Spartinivicinus marinus TaxID=2994442 RepID=A0A853IE72_9GAMM|nr:ribosome assembly RNA-binding protein YhbY [Spartinivicinus marinus]MCX4027975.1 ribosome assembly RNA-binding protein YhbY [Spartinivicinus marinus]NYZ68251.1 ribosome assembly RNA-binding protein YhbY [Spartinivicinus marinus]
MALTAAQKKRFRTIGHNLKPVVTIASNGLSAGVLEETTRALADHELIKVKFAVGDREAKKAFIGELCKEVGAELVQTIGNIALIYKPAKEPNPALSNLLRS